MNRTRMTSRLAAVVAALACWTGSADAATRYVSTCGSNGWTGFNVNCLAPHGPKRTIQAAIDASADGDVINVMPGVYEETIDLDGKAITIVGLAGAATTIIDGDGDGPVVTCNSFEGSDTVLQGLTITGGRTEQSGGGMLNALSSPTIIACVFDDNRAWVSGGGIANVFASPSIINCTFADNWANSGVANSTGLGGAISIEGGGTPEVIGCDFFSNTARTHGGALAITGGSPTIEDCTFSTNVLLVSGHGLVGVAPAMGSAIFVQASNPTFDGCEVSGNVIRARGAIGVYGGSPSFVGCTVSDNVSHATKGATGGAMYVINGANVSLLGCQFTGNESREDGGALKIVASTVNATLCGFMQNEGSTWGGGAIGVNNASNATFSGCTIVDNHSNTRAGAIYAINSSLTLGGCTISTNDAATQGGAIYAATTDLNINGCSFNGNLANGAGTVFGGGAITFEGDAVGVASIHDTTFTGNSSKAGGAVQLKNGEMNFTECVFESNHATDEGGGITSVPIAYLNVTNSQFLDNSTDGVGGAVMCNANTNVIGSLFSGNSALRGGAARSDEGFWAHSRFFGCRFVDNSASEAGAAVQLDNGAFIWMANCIVEDNTAPVGKGAIGIVAGVAILDMTNCTVANNSGGGLYLDDALPASRIKNSIVWGNTNGGSIVGDMPSVRFSNVQGGAPGVGNINANPRFQNIAIGDYALTPASPCIDAGANWAMIRDSIDLDGDGDTTELLPLDYNGNPRFSDNPGARNTGCGGGAKIDMGPIESAGVVTPSLTPGDVNGDGVINVTDLLAVISAWGPCPGTCCPAEFNFDGQINVTDLLIVISNWG